MKCRRNKPTESKTAKRSDEQTGSRPRKDLRDLRLEGKTATEAEDTAKHFVESRSLRAGISVYDVKRDRIKNILMLKGPRSFRVTPILNYRMIRFFFSGRDCLLTFKNHKHVAYVRVFP
jgi:hypothetical protein